MSYVWTPETDASVDEKLGLVAMKIPFTIPPEVDRVARLRRLLTWVPDEVRDLGLPLIKREIKEEENGGAKVSFQIDGVIDTSAAKLGEAEEFSLDGSTSEDPIEQHPRIQQFIKDYGGERKDDGTVVFSLTLAVNGQTIPNPFHGTETYFVPGMIWTRTFVTTAFPDRLVLQLGSLGTPPVGRRGQKPPPLQGSAVWFLARVAANWRGNVWKASESWMSTGKNGVPPGIYDYR